MPMYLYGASGHAKVIIEILENSGIPVNGLIDDNEKITNLLGYKCNTFNSNIIKGDSLIVISIGNNAIRKNIADKLKNAKIGTIIDNSAVVSRRAEIGIGTVIMPGAIINSSTIIGNHSIINTNASIDHECIIGDFVHISPGVSLAGNVSIGEGSHIGTGANIIPNIKIGKWCIVSAGAVIIKDIPDYSVVVGNPGRIIRTIKDEN